jgi:hypothetical protein
MRPRLRTPVLTGLGLLSLVPLAAPGSAQIRGSERATVSQVSDGTTVTVDYARPRVRGRSPVFGGLVDWGHVWTPGANSATTLAVDRPVTLNGVAVPEGAWSVWFIPGEGDWEVVLDPDERLYHTQPPEPDDDQLRFRVSPGAGAFTEALTWEFPMVDREGMDLRFRWDEVQIDFRIDVESTAVTETPPEEARAIAGSYEVEVPPEMQAEGAPPTMSFEIAYEDGVLRGGLPMGPPGEMARFELLPRASWIYSPGWMMDGEVFEQELEIFMEFDEEEGTVQGLEMRGVVDDRIDRVMMRATKVR